VKTRRFLDLQFGGSAQRVLAVIRKGHLRENDR
jgi:hypothetical protein